MIAHTYENTFYGRLLLTIPIGIKNLLWKTRHISNLKQLIAKDYWRLVEFTNMTQSKETFRF